MADVNWDDQRLGFSGKASCLVERAVGLLEDDNFVLPKCELESPHPGLGDEKLASAVACAAR